MSPKKQDDPHSGAGAVAGSGLAEELARAARAFVAALTPANVARARFPFDDPARLDWHYVPRSRPGAALAELGAAERAALRDLLGALLSPRGMERADGVIRLERVLGELTRDPGFRDPANYAIAVFGDPASSAPHAWRFEGHHLSLTTHVVPGIGVAVTPAFFGANPAEIPAHRHDGGFRLLGAEEDAAFALVRSLEGEAREAAIIADRSLGDVVSGPGREDALKRFEGAPLSRLGEGRREAVFDLLARFAGVMREEIAREALAKARADGAEALRFAWAGALERGRPHYFRIHGPSVLVEYDNTQNGANHVHSLWIDPADLFGRDLLRRHHEAAH